MTDISSEYDRTVNYLYGLQKHGIKLGLSNTRELMSLLGKPHNAFQSVHIAGTNGKGSTATAISSILIESGFKVGLFTSPHLVSFTERIRINNKCISESEVIELASHVRNSMKATDLNPTFFEVVTAMAFYYFASNNVDWVIVETGMGGRLDATNVITPDLTVITNISRDHCEFLGDTISEITYEKAGIIKQGVPLITASLNSQVVNHLSELAEKKQAPIHVYGKDFSGAVLNMDRNSLTIKYRGDREFNSLTAPVTGTYQLYNICLAVRACEILMAGGIEISTDSILEGLENMHLEGRLEQVADDPPVILDSAHNPDASKALSETMKNLYKDKKIILIAGIMDDKDIEGILSPVVEIAHSVIVTKAKYERAASPEKLKSIMDSIHNSDAGRNLSSLISADSIKEAISVARSSNEPDQIVLITGSFYTTGEVKEVLGCDSILPRLREYR